MGHGSRSEARGAEVGEAGNDAQPRRKRPRLSNWRRRKQRAEQRTVPEQAAATADDEAGDQRTVSYHAGAGDEKCGGLAPNDSPADAPINVPNSRVSLTLRAGESILPSRRSLRKLLRRLLARHHRCSYHMLLRRHLAERPSSTRGGGAEWSEVKRFAWAVCATVLPEGLLGSHQNVKEMVRATMRTLLREALTCKQIDIPAGSTARFRTTRSQRRALPPEAIRARGHSHEGREGVARLIIMPNVARCVASAPGSSPACSSRRHADCLSAVRQFVTQSRTRSMLGQRATGRGVQNCIADK